MSIEYNCIGRVICTVENVNMITRKVILQAFSIILKLIIFVYFSKKDLFRIIFGVVLMCNSIIKVDIRIVGRDFYSLQRFTKSQIIDLVHHRSLDVSKFLV